MILETNHGENSDNDSNIKNLIEIHKIKAENIDMNAYFLSLTDTASTIGLLTEKDMADMQSQIYDILSENIWIYTKGTSTSVTSSEANELMLAILYALNCFCISETGTDINPMDESKLEDLIKIFKEKNGIRKCYQKGLKSINKTSAQEIAADKMAGEVHKIIESYDNLFDFDEVENFEKEMESKDIKNKIISQSVMTDMEFNLLCENILKCKTAEEKAALIIKSILSAGDFLDILNAQCLFGDEYFSLYKKLSEQSPETLAFLIDNLENTDDEWQKYLSEFIEKAKILD